MVLQGHYDIFLLLASIAIAVFAAYTALSFIARINDPYTEHLRVTRIGASGLVAGLGIWSMHFVSILALNLPIPVRFDGAVTILSLVVAVFACIVGLSIASFKSVFSRLVIGGGCVGLGIAAMHYVGMAAMHMSAIMQFDPILTTISVLIAVSAAIAALWIAYSIGSGKLPDSFRLKIIAAVIMGGAISGMHYTGMAATQIYSVPLNSFALPGFILDNSIIGASLTITAILLMSLALWSYRLIDNANLVKANEQKVSAITENLADVVITIDTEGFIEFANKSIERVFGYRPEEIIGRKINILIPSPWRENHDRFIADYLRTGNGRIIGIGPREVQAVHKSGSLLPVDLAISTTTFAGKKIFIGTLRDISERIENQQRLDYLAGHDILTDLHNRQSFQDHTKQALNQAKQQQNLVAVLYLDLDRFKAINDTLGHSAGDYLLQETARRLTTCVDGNGVTARLSSDEFAILLNDIDTVEDITAIARKVVASFSEPFVYVEQELFITVSIGISIFPNDSDDPTAMIQHASFAMYRTKAEGRNNYRHYTADMNPIAVEQLQLEADLRYALERDEFVLYYQPQFDARTETVVGVEALLRWQHPERGLVEPGDFIFLLEQTGLIVPVGEWVLRTACSQNVAWQAAGFQPAQIAVNLSALQFNDRGVIGKIKNILHETGMAPQYLELEFTETVLLRQTNHTANAFRELKTLGVQLAIDDFGIGYSSLSYLRKFPIHTLKIDRSFIRNININADNAAIVRLIINMAESLGMNVIAEGIESQAQREYLQQLNCWKMQGYFFSKPKPVDDLLPMLQLAEIATTKKLSNF